jgi:fructosamine-3-kinase
MDTAILEHIAQRTGKSVGFVRSIGGGSIHEAAEITIGGKSFFLKSNRASAVPMFTTEQAGLDLLRTASLTQNTGITVPRPHHQGLTPDGRHAWLLIDHLRETRPTGDFFTRFGTGLARLHRDKGNGTFGLSINNYIGSLPQTNITQTNIPQTNITQTSQPQTNIPKINITQTNLPQTNITQTNLPEDSARTNWPDFFITHRLEPQFRKALADGTLSSSIIPRINRLYTLLNGLLPQCEPSLLHGDLWSGNFMAVIPDPENSHNDTDQYPVTSKKRTPAQTSIQTQEPDPIPGANQTQESAQNQTPNLILNKSANPLHDLTAAPTPIPAIFDPAVYYGHREVDLAFTRMFGGFAPEFYEAYNAEWPLEDGHKERVDLYNLYPLLVHVNLFGGGYIGQTLRILNRYAQGKF